MTVEEILAALQAIMDEAAGQPLNDDQVERYEKLEKDLQTRRASDAAQTRHAAYNAVTPPTIIPGHTAPADKDAEKLTRAFNHYLRTGRENADIAELRAQSEGTASEGGYLVPPGFRDKLVERMKAFGGIAEDVETITTSSGEPLPWPTVDDVDNVGEIVKEGNTFTGGDDIEFGSNALGAYEYMSGGAGAQPLRVSTVLLNDAAFDVEGLVTKLLGQRIARIQAPHIVRGSGNGEPLGLTTGLTVGNGKAITTAANTGLTYDDLIHFTHGVDAAYRENGSLQWGFNDKTLEIVQKMKDSHGDPIWRAAADNMATPLQGGVLLGYRVRIDNSFPDFVANSQTVNWGVFGDLREGYVRRRINDVQILVNPYARMSYRQVEYSAWARMDATQQNTFAYVALTGKV
jgi:HK97 family phage major capsid protein